MQQPAEKPNSSLIEPYPIGDWSHNDTEQQNYSFNRTMTRSNSMPELFDEFRTSYGFWRKPYPENNDGRYFLQIPRRQTQRPSSSNTPMPSQTVADSRTGGTREPKTHQSKNTELAGVFTEETSTSSNTCLSHSGDQKAENSSARNSQRKSSHLIDSINSLQKNHIKSHLNTPQPVHKKNPSDVSLKEDNFTRHGERTSSDESDDADFMKVNY